MPLGSGIPGAVLAVTSLLVLPGGNVVAGGFFSITNPRSNNIAWWNGTAWSPLGVGTAGEVDTLQPLPNGDILAGGAFNKAGGLPAPGVAVWGCRCHADFIPDGFVTGDDYDAFVYAFIDGLASTDFNSDGFVNADDFDAFSEAFVNGC